MVFSSIQFILVFLPLALICFYLTPNKYKNFIILLESLVFYAYGEPKFVFILVCAVLFDYVLALAIHKENQRIQTLSKDLTSRNKKKEHKQNIKGDINRYTLLKNMFFALGICLHIFVLFIFKIMPDSLGLPLGVSFYTFQSMSYIIDVYRGELIAEKNIIDLGTYICMFPQLVAGPIVRYDEVETQLKKPTVSLVLFDKGLKDFTIGLAMKVLLADRLSFFWNELSKIGYVSISTSVAWLGAVSYSLQIYFDFFGYSVMAIGLGEMLGFKLPVNFEQPYISKSIGEFYRRWHITLGRWFKKYVYISLGGNRVDTITVIRNLYIVWIFTALWHGIGINYMVWGMLLCTVIVIERYLPKYVLKNKNTEGTGLIKILCDLFKHGYVLFIIIISWVCFAITDEKQLLIYLGRMFGLIPGIAVKGTLIYDYIHKFGPTILIGILISTKWAQEYYKKLREKIVGMLILAVLFWVSVYFIKLNGDNPFMYFRF